MKFFLGLFLSLAATISVTASSVQNETRKIASQCQYNPQLPPLFNVIESSQKQITVEFGPFAKFFDLSNTQYSYSVEFKGSKETQNYKVVQDDTAQIVAKGDVSQDYQRITIPVTKTGVYFFKLFQNEKNPFWKQKVFAIALTEHVLTEDEKSQLAEKFSPILNYHDNELYFPVSLEYLTNQVDKDPNLDNEPFRLTNKKISTSAGGLFNFFGSKPVVLDVKFQFKDLLKVLPYYGNSDSVLKSGLSSSADTILKSRYGKDHITVYYSVFENPKYKEIYINYHFFYSYDPKNGTEGNDVMAAHIFDRESMTVVLRSTTKQPLSVFFGAHLASQRMAQIKSDGSISQSWDSGRVYVNWPEANRQNDRPVAAIALGSHAVYPKAGNYAVMLGGGSIKLLSETAGGNKILYPETITDYQKTATSYSYKLKSLDLDKVNSNCDSSNELLSFSGSTVDVLGPSNATFPPYTDREEDYFSYSDPNAPLFDMTK